MHRAFTFLVLQDDEDARFLCCRSLQRVFRGCAIIEASSCEEALQRATGKSCDAVLTDHHLAENDGAAFVAAMRERGARCPIVMVTLHDNPDVHRRAYAAGASRVFHPGDTDFLAYLRAELCGASDSLIPLANLACSTPTASTLVDQSGVVSAITSAPLMPSLGTTAPKENG